MSWYAFRLAPMKERNAHELLTARGFDSLFAHEKYEARSRRHRRHVTVERIRPLLHGYALLRHDGTPDWWHRCFAVEWPLIHGRVLKAVIGTQGVPSPIPQRNIDMLSQRSGITHKLPQAKPVAVGSLATITAGPFKGFVAPVEEIQGKEKQAHARLTVMLFGRPCEATVQLVHLKAA